MKHNQRRRHREPQSGDAIQNKAKALKNWIAALPSVARNDGLWFLTASQTTVEWPANTVFRLWQGWGWSQGAQWRRERAFVFVLEMGKDGMHGPADESAAKA